MAFVASRPDDHVFKMNESMQNTQRYQLYCGMVPNKFGLQTLSQVCTVISDHPKTDSKKVRSRQQRGKIESFTLFYCICMILELVGRAPNSIDRINLDKDIRAFFCKNSIMSVCSIFGIPCFARALHHCGLFQRLRQTHSNSMDN